MRKMQLIPLAFLSLLKDHRVPVIPLGAQLKTLNTRFAQMFFKSLQSILCVCMLCLHVCLHTMFMLGVQRARREHWLP